MYLKKLNHFLKYIDTFKYNILIKKTGFMLSSPTILVIEPTNLCNYSCKKCLRSYTPISKQRNAGFITLDNLETILKKIPNSIEFIGLNGFGEPLLHPKFIDIISIIRKYKPNVKIGFHTNGALINDQIINACLKYNLTDIEISLDTINPKKFKIIHSTKASPDKILQNIKKLIEARNKSNSKLRIGIAYVMQYENRGQLKLLINTAHKLKVDFVGPVVPVNPFFGYDISKWKTPYKDMQKEIVEAQKVQKKLKMNVQFPKLERGKIGSANISTKENIGCTFPFDLYPIITWDGYSMPCVWLQEIKYNTGNLLTEDFNEIWNGKKIRNIRKLFSNNKVLSICQTCKPGNFNYKK